MSKWSIWASGQTIKGTITGLSSSLMTMAAGAGGLAYAAAGTVGVIFGAVIHKRILDMEHDREEQRMLSLYRREISAQTGRSADQVNFSDLERAASQNVVLAEALERNDAKVRSRMIAWVAGAVLATVVVGLLFTPLGGAAALLGGILPSTTGLTGATWLAHFIGGAAIKGLFGALTFNIVRPIADNLGDKWSGVTRHNTHDYIKELSNIRAQGRQLLPEQVLGAYVKANPDIEAAVSLRHGKPFDKIVAQNDSATLKQILAELEARYDIRQVTHDINSGRIQVTELAYLTRGQQSGVEPVEPDTRTTTEKMKDGIEHAKQKVTEVSNAAQMKAKNVAAHVSHAWEEGKHKVATSLGMHVPQSASFVERTGKSAPGAQTSFTEMVDGQRSSPVLAGLPPVSSR